MASRAQRAENKKFELIFKTGGVLGLIVMAGLWGVPGLTGLPILLLCGIFALLCVGILAVVWRSRLILGKRIGICASATGACISALWFITKAPPVWIEQPATVLSVKAPPCTVETDYIFRYSASDVKVTLSKEVASSVIARKEKPVPVALYVNPQNPRQVAERSTAGWTRVQATPVATRIKERGSYKMKVQHGGVFSARTDEFESPVEPGVRVGSRVAVYIEPVNDRRASLSPQATEGGQKHGLLGCGLVLIVVGAGFIVYGRTWHATERDSERMPSCVAAETPSDGRRQLAAREQLAMIDWRQFERVVARILEHMEWQVTLAGGGKPDGGADMLARKNGETAVVQCKHWKNTMVQLKVLRELLGTKASVGFSAHEAVLFTTSRVTDDAMRFAQENKITVFDGDAVVRLVEEVGVGNFPELVEPNRKLCPKCDAPMVLRETERPFWGCSTFPRCRGTIEVSGKT